MLIGNIGLLADANQLKTIQHKQRVTHEKIKRLKTKKRYLLDSVISVEKKKKKTLTYQDIKDIFSV